MSLCDCSVLFPMHKLVGRTPRCKKQGKALMHTLESLCLCTWKLCLFSPLLHMWALFCASVLRATSWGSLQASCLRSQRLSANPAPFYTQWSTQLFPLVITDQTHTCTHVLGFQEGHRRCKKLLEESLHFCEVSVLAGRMLFCIWCAP